MLFLLSLRLVRDFNFIWRILIIIIINLHVQHTIQTHTPESQTLTKSVLLYMIHLMSHGLVSLHCPCQGWKLQKSACTHLQFSIFSGPILYSMTNLLLLLCFFIKILLHANGSNAKTKRKIIKRLNDFKFYTFICRFQMISVMMLDIFKPVWHLQMLKVAKVVCENQSHNHCNQSDA